MSTKTMRVQAVYRGTTLQQRYDDQPRLGVVYRSHLESPTSLDRPYCSIQGGDTGVPGIQRKTVPSSLGSFRRGLHAGYANSAGRYRIGLCHRRQAVNTAMLKRSLTWSDDKPGCMFLGLI